ncbi:DUF4304 domain-containing protein [Aurantiacibacter marinus]|uniref:DUF4304 domain-containing protein n=1 Tax=Aurantiacibacter marinus TaxID=874156 RepID=A0A0H0XK44_9SPHN|nr:DUF4304 domain-containing protein [Aurantiacibacter marinus]KLI62973.1 hypothetical protein AAV99_13105 [Aurantiacibacter marinus]
MDAAIRQVVVPHLRALGFKGSLPDFHRPRGEAVDLLTFQFNRNGGAFVVELGRVAAGGFDFHGKHIPAARAKTRYLKERHRLGSELRVNYGDHWFAFAIRDPADVAREVCAELDRAELWAFLDELQVLGG